MTEVCFSEANAVSDDCKMDLGISGRDPEWFKMLCPLVEALWPWEHVYLIETCNTNMSEWLNVNTETLYLSAHSPLCFLYKHEGNFQGLYFNIARPGICLHCNEIQGLVIASLTSWIIYSGRMEEERENCWMGSFYLYLQRYAKARREAGGLVQGKQWNPEFIALLETACLLSLVTRMRSKIRVLTGCYVFSEASSCTV